MALRTSFVLCSLALAGHVLPSDAFVGTHLPALRAGAAPVSKLQFARQQPRAAAPLTRTKMAFSAAPVQNKPSVFARFQKTAFAAVVAFMMLLGAPGASHAEMKKGSAGGSFIKSSSTASAGKTSSPTAMKGVASPSVADTKAAPAKDKVKPTKNVATTIKEGADGSKTKVVTTTTTDENGKKSVKTEKTIIKAGNKQAAAPAADAAAPAAAAPGGTVHVIHSGAPAPSTGGMVAAAAGAAVGAAAMSALAPPAPPWYNPMGWGMPNPMMGQPMMPMQTVSPFGMAMSIKTAVLTSIFLGLTLTIALIFLFRR